MMFRGSEWKREKKHCKKIGKVKEKEEKRRKMFKVK